MKFHEKLYTLFDEKELRYIAGEATLIYTNEHDEIDYLLWLRDKGAAEIRLDDNPSVRIQKLKEEEEYDTKEAFLQMLQNSKPTRLTYVEVD